jgi:hypothetical protein
LATSAIVYAEQVTTNRQVEQNMKVMIALVVAVMASVPLGSTQDVPIFGGFATAEEFLKFPELQRITYAVGFYNGLIIASLVADADLPKVRKLNDCSAGRSPAQTAEIIRKYIADRPEQWNVPLSVLGYQAIANSCPQQLKR